MAEPVIYLIGGTTEANQAAALLREEGYDVTISVTTSMGARLAMKTAGQPADTGCKDAAQMAARAAELGAAAIVDCSHPFASAASAAARSAAAQTGLPYFRYCRPPASLDQTGVFRVGSWAEAVGFLTGHPGRALLTVGIRNLEPFVRERIDFIARVLPRPESLAECERLGIEPQNIIAAYPPFSVDFTRACIRHAGASVLVTKESGEVGGLGEKGEAARAEGIDILIVDRPADPDAIHELDALVKSIRETLLS